MVTESTLSCTNDNTLINYLALVEAPYHSVGDEVIFGALTNLILAAFDI